MGSKDPIEKKLRNLQGQLKGGDAGKPVAFHPVPQDLAQPGAEQLTFDSPELKSVRRLQEALSADPRFEHLDRDGIAEIVEFAARVQLEPERNDHVGSFMKRNAKCPESRTCFFPVENLNLSEQIEVAGVSLLPVLDGGHEELKISVAPEIKAIAAVAVEGTDPRAMAERARLQAEHALRVLRISLREDRWVHPFQLRFRLGDHHAFESGLGGWEVPSDVGWELDLDAELLDLARRQPIWSAPMCPETKLERRIDRAMRWVEQAFLVGDGLLELLFCFFALEALLGDKSEGLKAQRLAFRRALLGSVTRERFAHPNRVAFLYEEVRSAAVHGSDPPEVDEKLLQAFLWDTRLALSEYAEYAQANDIKRPSKLLESLEKDPRRERLIEGLRRDEPKRWGSFLDTLAKS